MYHIIYQTTNLVNNKIYVGYHYQENNPYEPDGYLGSGAALLKAINKYGSHNFKRETLYVFTDQSSALVKEREIVTENFLSDKNNYNLTLGGGLPPSHKGIVKSKEHRNKISEAQKGKTIPNEVRDKISKTLTGRRTGPKSQKTKMAIKQSLLGRKHTTESKEKMRLNSPDRSGSLNPMFGRVKESNPNFGKKRSKESVAKIREAATKSQNTLECPHCNKVGKRSGMQRWHMDNCRLRLLV